MREIGGTNGEYAGEPRRQGFDGARALTTTRATPRSSNDGNRVVFRDPKRPSRRDRRPPQRQVGHHLRDIAGKKTTLVSRATGVAGAVGDGASRAGLISGDGNFVAFTSSATNLDGHDSTPDRDVSGG